MNKIGKICIIIPYFGKWPDWGEYFLKSCSNNPDIDWFIFTDCQLPGSHPENLQIIPFTLEDFNQLASKKLELDIQLSHPYKLCEFKPAYGHVFEDYIKDSEFWGYGDMDLVYGKIGNFFLHDIMQNHDIISNHTDFITGHFCILRNTLEIKMLYRHGGAYKAAFLNRNYTGFDEQIKNIGINPDPKKLGQMKKVDLQLHILASKLIKPFRGLNPFKSNSQSQNNDSSQLRDFSSIVNNAEAGESSGFIIQKLFNRI